MAQLMPASSESLYSHLAIDSRVGRLGELASVDIGVVTGANDFFTLTKDRATSLPSSLVRRGVSKAAHVRGARLSSKEHSELLDAGQPALMFVADRRASRADLEAVREYLQDGQEAGIDQRYKCRVRSPWWALPIPKAGVPDLLLTYCSNDFPRLALNEAEVLQTNTIHGVNLVAEVDPAAIAAGFFNSLTLLSAELVGRSYGGGVLKLEPTEAEALLMPPIPDELADLLPGVDSRVRARDLPGVLNLVDEIVLERALGLTSSEVGALRAGRDRLRDRRRQRGKPARSAA